jgi:hypothetical protein
MGAWSLLWGVVVVLVVVLAVAKVVVLLLLLLLAAVPAPIPRRHPDFADTYQHKVLANT